MKITKTRRSGFTLVELLIVILIIAILAGMLLLATGGATDSAKASKIISDLRSAKSAAMLMMLDSGPETIRELAIDQTNKFDWYSLAISLDKYMDRPIFGASDGNESAQYMLGLVSGKVDVDGNRVERLLIGFSTLGWNADGDIKSYIDEGVAAKLAQNAEKSGLYCGDGNNGSNYDIYDGKNNYETVYMILN